MITCNRHVTYSNRRLFHDFKAGKSSFLFWDNALLGGAWNATAAHGSGELPKSPYKSCSPYHGAHNSTIASVAARSSKCVLHTRSLATAFPKQANSHRPHSLARSSLAPQSKLFAGRVDSLARSSSGSNQLFSR